MRRTTIIIRAFETQRHREHGENTAYFIKVNNAKREKRFFFDAGQ
jgi:hypothetical protein